MYASPAPFPFTAQVRAGWHKGALFDDGGILRWLRWMLRLMKNRNRIDNRDFL